ncbi:MAG TPA: helix-turn-helix transcriptional regulator [Thermomicrobiales bacterium]|nr:helix-turn-helix transcriptional regulator [Thermomicrobiales bacterium]
MSASEHLRSRGHRRGMKILADFGDAIKDARLSAGLSFEEVGRRAGMSADKVWRAQHARLLTLSFVDAAQIAAVLGLDLVAATYPSGIAVRDAGQAKRVRTLIESVGRPLRYRADAVLPRGPDGKPDYRAWDLVLYGHGERTQVEVVAHLRDMQEQLRKHNLKRRDDPAAHFLLVLADTRHNRTVLREYGDLFSDLPRLRTANVLRALRQGEHPPTGLIFL